MRSRFLSLILSALLGACAAVPAGPPEEVAPKIVALLEAGKADEADEMFDASKGDADALYPLLYEQARTRYERGEAQSSAGILRFMARHYEGSRAVREALVYSLFLERAGTEVPPPEKVEELDKALADLRAAGGETPPWVELVRAQQAIDRGDLGTAREALARFQQTHQEGDPELTVYVEDVERYLKSHP